MSGRFGIGWWLLGLLVAGMLSAVVVLVGGLVVKPKLPAKPPSTPPKIEVAVEAGSDVSSAMAESAALLGPTPLFLPTIHNSSSVDLPPSARREPGSTFPMVSPHLIYTEDSFDVALSDPLPMPASALEVLRYGQSAPPFPVLGRFDQPPRELPERTLHVEATASGGGRIVFADSFLIEGAPLAFRADWRPMELLISVNPAGQISEPTLVQGSGSPEVDRFIVEYLHREVKIGLRVLPGFYSVRVGP